MCGRAYETYTEEELFIRYISNRPMQLPDLKPTYNLCPTQKTPVVFVENGERKIEMMRWGLVPTWAKDLASVSKYSLINSKAEEISEKRSYSAPFRQRRCLVPVSGFYEWKQVKPKIPFAISLVDDPIMSMGGIWEEWISKETGEIIRSCAIITLEANEFMNQVHHRMPVIISREDEAEWLDPTITDPAKLQKFLKPIESEKMKLHEVSSEVNSPRNNHKALLDPVTKKEVAEDEQAQAAFKLDES